MAERKDFIRNRTGVTYVDLFAGAGGFSEGFLQAFTDDKCYDFLLASDINRNCELTHIARYNRQLGLSTQFLCQDITEDDFLPNLLRRIGSRAVDVVTGGPSCQSFSLAGMRKRFDKRDNLFYHYLKVIKALRPKYFVMENVKGILTKEQGKFVNEILGGIRSILDTRQLPSFLSFVGEALPRYMSPFMVKVWLAKLEMEAGAPEGFGRLYGTFFGLLEEQLKVVTQSIEYKVSKSNQDVNTVRHGILLLKEQEKREEIAKALIDLKAHCNVNNDHLTAGLNDAIHALDDEQLVQQIANSLHAMRGMTQEQNELDEMERALQLYAFSFDDCVNALGRTFKGEDLDGLQRAAEAVRLYRIEQPIVVRAADYGVPQNRERVLFIGCRKDQALITGIAPTVHENERVTVYEALWDLDMVGNGETAEEYREVPIIAEYKGLLRSRSEWSSPQRNGRLYAEWSRSGRLQHRFTFEESPFYVRDAEDLQDPQRQQRMELFNHQSSLQSENVRRRLRIIAEHGDYDAAKGQLREEGVDSDKRNYTVLRAEGQSPTVCTMPDDFIHYASHRPLTVREMARLQSFDDSFVFQGKRQTGGNKRKDEIPQYTLVGNAVPPLMARAVANEILRRIKMANPTPSCCKAHEGMEETCCS